MKVKRCYLSHLYKDNHHSYKGKGEKPQIVVLSTPSPVLPPTPISTIASLNSFYNGRFGDGLDDKANKKRDII